MRRLALLVWLIGPALTVCGYDFMTTRGLRWRDGGIPMKLQLDETLAPFPLLDGKSSWNEAAQEALDLWNAQLTRVQFTTVSGAGQGDGNDTNEVFFSDNVYGHRFGGLVLAVTTAWRIRSERVEADTIFNTAIDWDSYRGAVNFNVLDLRRVAAHEFGHTLGLDHPNVAGQVKVALMNGIVSDLDDLRPDDIRGARALYLPDAKYALDVNVFPPGSGRVSLSPPPDTNGLYQAGTLVTLTARPNRRQRFNFWDGDELQSARRWRLRVVDNESLTANFSTNTAPVVFRPPRSQFASDFDSVTFTARARGRGPIVYQWQHDGADILDATNATLVLNFVGHEDSGLYSLRATNSRGPTRSKPARLVVDGY